MTATDYFKQEADMWASWPTTVDTFLNGAGWTEPMSESLTALARRTAGGSRNQSFD